MAGYEQYFKAAYRGFSPSSSGKEQINILGNLFRGKWVVGHEIRPSDQPRRLMLNSPCILCNCIDVTIGMEIPNIENRKNSRTQRLFTGDIVTFSIPNSQGTEYTGEGVLVLEESGFSVSDKTGTTIGVHNLHNIKLKCNVWSDQGLDYQRLFV